MIFDGKRYECKTFVPCKRDYTEYTFYSIRNKREVKVMGYTLSDDIPLSGVWEVGKKIVMNGEDLLYISSDLDDDAFNNHCDKYREEKALLFEVFIKDVLDHNGLEDNEFSRHLVRRLMCVHGVCVHGGPVSKVWEEMADYVEIYDKAEKFFSKKAGSKNA